MIRGLLNTLTNPRLRKEWRFNTLYKLGRWILPDYRFQWPTLAWWQDADFNSYIKRFGMVGSASVDRRWNLSQLTKLAQSVAGDTAECGVYQGTSSYLISRAFTDRQHFAFDS